MADRLRYSVLLVLIISATISSYQIFAIGSLNLEVYRGLRSLEVEVSDFQLMRNAIAAEVTIHASVTNPSSLEVKILGAEYWLYLGGQYIWVSRESYLNRPLVLASTSSVAISEVITIPEEKIELIGPSGSNSWLIRIVLTLEVPILGQTNLTFERFRIT